MRRFLPATISKGGFRSSAITVFQPRYLTTASAPPTAPVVVPGRESEGESTYASNISEADKQLFRDALSGKMDKADIAAAEIDQQRRLGGPGLGPKSGEMLMAFTCNKCNTRSVKRFTKHSYTKGIVIVECPGCKGKHLIADHLGWFEDGRKTIVEILKEQGEEVKYLQMEGLLNVE